MFRKCPRAIGSCSDKADPGNHPLANCKVASFNTARNNRVEGLKLLRIPSIIANSLSRQRKTELFTQVATRLKAVVHSEINIQQVRFITAKIPSVVPSTLKGKNPSKVVPFNFLGCADPH